MPKFMNLLKSELLIVCIASDYSTFSVYLPTLVLQINNAKTNFSVAKSYVFGVKMCK